MCKMCRSGDTKPIKPELVGSTSRLGSRWEQNRRSRGNKIGEDISSIWEQDKRRYLEVEARRRRYGNKIGKEMGTEWRFAL